VQSIEDYEGAIQALHWRNCNSLILLKINKVFILHQI